MNGINEVTLLGNLTDEPQIRTTPNGKKVANFTLATNEGHRDQTGNWVSEAEYHRIIGWEGFANTIEKCLHKGSPVFVKGKLKTRQYTDKNNQKRYVTEILINQIVLIGDAPNRCGNNSGYGQQNTQQQQQMPQRSYQPQMQQNQPQQNFNQSNAPINDNFPF